MDQTKELVISSTNTAYTELNLAFIHGKLVIDEQGNSVKYLLNNLQSLKLLMLLHTKIMVMSPAHVKLQFTYIMRC